MKTLLALFFAVCAPLVVATGAAAANPAPVKLRMSVIDPLLPQLGTALGYFAREGLELEFVKVEDVSKEDYLMQEPLVAGRLDVSCHWFHHVIFGVRHNLPVKAVLLTNDSPGIKILVAKRLADEIRSAADFKGRNIAEGAGYATKSVLTNALARRVGLPAGSYTPVMQEVDGRREAVLKGLAEGRVDIMTFMEPMTSALLATDQVSVLYDLTNRAGTIRAVGDVWPAQCVFLAERYIEAHPDTVQHLVNAYVRTMRFVDTHTAEEIVAQLPAAYFEKRDRASETDRIRKAHSNFAHQDYAFTPSAAKLALDTVLASAFDASEEGRFRATGEKKNVQASDLYTNRFVDQAMKEIK